MDDKAYSETNNVTAPDPPAGAIVITATGTKDKDKLTDCYFVLTNNNTTWTLYSKGGTQLATGQTNVTGFTFNHDLLKGSPSTKIAWSITNFNVTQSGITITITGSWSNDDDPDAAAGPQSGSFQGSSSGSIDPVSASASA